VNAAVAGVHLHRLEASVNGLPVVTRDGTTLVQPQLVAGGSSETRLVLTVPEVAAAGSSLPVVFRVNVPPGLASDATLQLSGDATVLNVVQPAGQCATMGIRILECAFAAAPQGVDATGVVQVETGQPGAVVSRMELGAGGLPVLSTQATTLVSFRDPVSPSNLDLFFTRSSRPREGAQAAVLSFRNGGAQDLLDVDLVIELASDPTGQVRVDQAIPEDRVTALLADVAVFRFPVVASLEDTNVTVISFSPPGDVTYTARALVQGQLLASASATQVVTATGPTVAPNVPPRVQPGRFASTFQVADASPVLTVDVTVLTGPEAVFTDASATVGSGPGVGGLVEPGRVRFSFAPPAFASGATDVNVVLGTSALQEGFLVQRLVLTANQDSTALVDVTNLVTSGTPGTTVTAPAPGTRVPTDGVTPLTIRWDSQASTDTFFLEFGGPDAPLLPENSLAPDPVNGFGGTGGGLVVLGRQLTVVVPPGFPAGGRQIRVIPIRDFQALGPFSNDISVSLVVPTPTDCPVTITGPASGSRFAPGDRITFTWTGSALDVFGVEHSGADLPFLTLDGPDPVNGFGGLGGGFPAQGPRLGVDVPPGVSGVFQVRVFCLDRFFNLLPFRPSAAIDVEIRPP
jgi:hypothetical protein